MEYVAGGFEYVAGGFLELEHAFGFQRVAPRYDLPEEGRKILDFALSIWAAALKALKRDVIPVSS